MENQYNNRGETMGSLFVLKIVFIRIGFFESLKLSIHPLTLKALP